MDELYTEIFKRFNKPLIHFAKSVYLNGDEDAAKDIVADCFIELYSRLCSGQFKEFEYDKNRFLKVLYGNLKLNTRYRCINFLKRRDIDKKYQQAQVLDFEYQLSALEIKSELTIRIWDEINKLPEKGREIVVLWSYGKTQYEISELMNLSITTVNRYFKDGLDLLRRVFNIPVCAKRKEIIIGKSYCKNGHLFTEDNIKGGEKNGKIRCKKCHRLSERKRYQQSKYKLQPA